MGGWNRSLSKMLSIALLMATIAVNLKPLWASPPVHLKLSDNSKTGAEGSSIQVNCSVSMSQAPKELKWELSSDDKPNVEQEMISQTTVTLRIVSLKRTNAGQYTCLLIMPDGKEEKKQFSLLVQQANDEVCNRFQFKCAKTRNCLFLKYRCDGVDDCGDGSDEQCDIDPCLNKFKCNNSRCIEHRLECDHVDHCGDHSDEHVQHCQGHNRPTSTAQPINDDNTYTWLQITVSSFIAVTLSLVFCISFIVIMVFRNRIRRLREQRIARAQERRYREDVCLNRHGDQMGGPSDPSSPSHGVSSDQQQFLLGPPHSHFGNIIVNVNNGVQYIPGYDYAILMDVPPPYSEVGTGQSEEANPPPPAYSTLEDENIARASGANSTPVSGQQMPHTEDRASHRHSHPTERCATVNAADLGSRESTTRAQTRQRETNRPHNESSASQTLPSGVNIINPEFLQSLLGPQVQTGDRSALRTTGDGLGGSPSHIGRVLPDPSVNLVHLSASPRHRSAGSPSSQQQQVADPGDTSVSRSQDTTRVPHSHTGLVGLSNAQSMSPDQGETVLPSSSEYIGNSHTAGGDHPRDECRQNLVGNAASLAGEDCGAGAKHVDDYYTESQNEEGTFLIRKPRHKPSSDQVKAETVSPPPLPPPNRTNTDNASNALLNEVSKRDDRLQPKPGHLAVQGGEILLHTPTGILCDPPSQSHPPPVPTVASDSPEAPELMIRNGSLMFGMPHQSTHHNPSPQNPSATSVDPASDEGGGPQSSTNQTQPRSGNTLTTTATAAANSNELSDTLHRKELQFKNGELVLESPKQTPSSQILSHLKGAYAEEDGMAEAIEPVVNTKRSGVAMSTKAQSQKINSDVVLPPKTHQQ